MDEIKAEARKDRLSDDLESGRIDGHLFMKRLQAKYAAVTEARDSKK